MERLIRFASALTFALTMIGATASFASAACNKDFTIYNKSSYTIKGFYASPHNTDDWDVNAGRKLTHFPSESPV